MKSKVTVSIALVLTIMLLPTALSAQGKLRPIADSGLIRLGPHQVLRVFVAAGDVNGDGISVRFRQMEYMEQDNIYSIASASASGVVTLPSNEAAFSEIPNTGAGVRSVVLSNSRNAKVTFIVFDTSTQRICTFIPD